MLELLFREALENDEPQAMLAIQLMKASAAELLHDEPGHVSVSQYAAKQQWSREEIRQRLAHIISLLSNFRNNRLGACALRIAQKVSDDLGEPRAGESAPILPTT